MMPVHRLGGTARPVFSFVSFSVCTVTGLEKPVVMDYAVLRPDVRHIGTKSAPVIRNLSGRSHR